MANFKSWQSGTSLFLALGMAAGAAAPIVMQAPVQAQTTFSDVSSSYWAYGYIQALSSRGVISGFPDGTFRPDAPVTRAQFAAMIRSAFDAPSTRSAINFVDVSSNYWAYSAIREAYTTGFLSGYPGNVFNPEQNIPRVQVLVSLANGLDYTASNVQSTLSYYTDASGIPDYARASVAAATEEMIVVNYPTLNRLNPNRNATRAEVAAFIYQALVSAGEAPAINSPYVVGGDQDDDDDTTSVVIPEGTTLPIRYDGAERILISPEEPDPVPVTLIISQNVTDQNGALLIPVGSQVEGELRIVEENGEEGTKFYAETLRVPSTSTNPSYTVDLEAESELITDTETITEDTDVGTVIRDAALGAAAAAAIAEITGEIDVEEVLGGAGIGTLIGLFLDRDEAELLVVDPDRDLNLTLTESLTVQLN
ncbi:MAG: S-layer homology domain-containing protein [Thainema sp.]